MPVFDLSRPTAEAQGQLNKFSVNADGRDDEAFVFGLDVVFTVANTEEAKVLALTVPGADDAYQRATERDDWKWQARVVPDISGAIMDLVDAKSGDSAIQGGAEIKAVIMRASKRVVTATVQVIMAGQTASRAAALAGLLRSTVALKMEAAQQALPFSKPKPVAVQLGGVIVAKDDDGETVWGRVVDMSIESGRVTVDVLTDTIFVDPETVTSCWPLVSGETVEKAIDSFKKGCKKAKVAPTYRAITLAVGEAYASNPPADGQYELTKDIVKRAVEFAKDLPDEDDVAPNDPGEGLPPEMEGEVIPMPSPRVGLA